INSHADYCAFIEIADNHFVASISPEQFIECDHGTMMTKPIKGTVKSTGRITKEQTSELQNSKNRAENLMIVDLLRNDLSKVSRLHSVNVTKLFDIESFNNVHHLVSTITSEIDCSKHTPFTAFLSAFPGGSITGAPKKRAQEIITELEAHPRRFYCGSIFMWDNDLDKFQSNILIRTVEIEKKKAFCWGGGGIVADSQLDEEYMESLNKIAHITGKLIET
ncbi:chorismate-binding protein, partial [Oleiphilus sp. HI0066]|uniref:chorismate-binding protein n=3 Tax=Oleiphilus TaxID=141450 RepID=UPI000AD1CB3A